MLNHDETVSRVLKELGVGDNPQELTSKVRRGFKIPVDATELECAIERACRNGIKLSELFLVINAPDEGEFAFELPLKMLDDLKRNLKADEELGSIEKDRKIDFSRNIDTKKLRIFYLFYAPKTLLLSSRKFNYPNVSKISMRPFSDVGGKASNIN